MEDLLRSLNAYHGSLRALARKAGVSISTVVGIKNGSIANPGILTVQAIQKALDELATEPDPQHAEAV
jgi:transcriptional regulator with XRE-family HTH domain